MAVLFAKNTDYTCKQYSSGDTAGFIVFPGQYEQASRDYRHACLRNPYRQDSSAVSCYGIYSRVFYICYE